MSTQNSSAVSRKRDNTTLADVAAYAGVSKVAVSVVLNGSRSEVRVSPQTRERILEAASALEYRPNAVARSLRRQRTDILGFYSAHGAHVDPRVPFYAEIWAGLREGCDEHRKDLLVRGTFRDRSDDDVFQELLNGQVDGLILFAGSQTPVVQRLMESRLPVIAIVHEIPGMPWVGVDDVAGGRLIARHLWEKGHRHVLYRQIEDMPATLQRRLEAFCDEAQKLKIEVRFLIQENHWPSEQEQAVLLDKAKHRPTAIACWNDDSADALADFCFQHQIRVPQDLAIIGFDGLPPTRRPAWKLSTISAPWADVACSAVNLLVEHCAGRKVPAKTVMPVEFLQGDTT